MDKKKVGAFVGVVGVAGAVTIAQLIDMKESQADYMTRNLVEEYAQKQSQAADAPVYQKDERSVSSKKVEYLLTQASQEAKPEEVVQTKPEPKKEEKPAEAAPKEEKPQEVEKPQTIEVTVPEVSDDVPASEPETPQPEYAFYGAVSGELLTIRSKESVDSEALGMLKKDDVVRGILQGDWVRFAWQGTTGYVAYEHLRWEDLDVIGDRQTGDSLTEEKKPEASLASDQSTDEKTSESSEIPQPEEEPTPAVPDASKEVLTRWTTEELNVRATAASDADIVRTLAKGEKIEGHLQGSWFALQDGSGYVVTEYLTDQSPEAAQPETPQPETPQPETPQPEAPQPEEPKNPDPQPAESAPTPEPQGTPIEGYVAESGTNVRKGPGTNYDILGTLNVNTKITGHKEGNWIRFDYNGQVGYVHADLVQSAPVEEQKPEPPKEDASVSETIQKMVDAAYAQLGKPYIFAEANPDRGFDCSGLTLWLYKTYAGISLPHHAGWQADYGYPVSWDNLQAGDLVFFDTDGGGYIGHVGIMVGGRQMIHASSYKSGVVSVSVDAQGGYWRETFVCARRILN